MALQSSYGIVGDGCFGASCALALKKREPKAKIILFGLPNNEGASKDYSKIIRTPYHDAEYVRLAQQAKMLWESESPYNNFIRRTGWVQAVKTDYKPFFDYPSERRITVTDLAAQLQLKSLPQLCGDELWLSEDIAIAQADLALQKVTAEAVKLGVQYERRKVSTLLVDNGSCNAIQCEDGTNFAVDTTILATGAWTPQFLTKAEIYFPPNFFTVSAVSVATLELSEEEFTKFHSMPILVTKEGEILPPSSHKEALTITSTQSYIIASPDEPDVEPPAENRVSHRTVLRKMMPEMESRPLTFKRWSDLMTPNQHPLVDRVPNVRGLHLAVGGSYHCYKFLPIFGDLVVDYLKGERTGLLSKWSWDHCDDTPIHAELLPDCVGTGSSS